MESMTPIVLHVNGETHRISVAPGATLLEVLRDRIGLKGTKRGCDMGQCGACTVLVNGEAVLSCLMLAASADGKEVTTIEGLERSGRLHPLQEAFVSEGAVQCGFCTPGMILSAKGLLDKEPDPTEETIREALSGNLCRCTGYEKIVQAVQKASVMMKQKEAPK
jgi:aerobic carbon-monoxide dehydrogenase small subunit